MTTPGPLLQVRGLHLAFATAGGLRPVLRGIDLDLHAGETLGLVGESGSGKSALASVLIGLPAAAARITAGQLHWRGRPLLTVDGAPPSQAALDQAWAGLRGREIGAVAQAASQALHPLRRVGAQLQAVLAVHQGLRGAAAQAQALALLADVGLPEPARVLDARPNQLSGGQNQRVLIALALAARPKLLLADEPSTGLDTHTQAVVLDLLAARARARGLALLLITHDLALAAQRCDRIAVLHGGQVVEVLPAAALARQARHAHTRALLAGWGSVPGPGPATDSEGHGQARCRSHADADTDARPASLTSNHSDHGDPPHQPGLVVHQLSHRHALRRRGLLAWRPAPAWQTALQAVDLHLPPGQACGVVGESGSGKSTLVRLVARLADPQGGRVWLDGQDLTATPAARAARAPWRGQVQALFQDAAASLLPTASAFDNIAAPLRRLRGLRGGALDAAVRAAAAQADLPSALLARHPQQLSGGQATRVALARALALQPRLLLLDEPTAALDAATQTRLVQRLDTLRRSQGLALLLVSHDLHLVRALCQQVLVLLHGQVVERGPVAQVLRQPRHPYTAALLQALPPPVAQADDAAPTLPPAAVWPALIDAPERPGVPGMPMAPTAAKPAGAACPLLGRCPRALPACVAQPVLPQPAGPGQAVACWNPLPG